MKQNNTVCLGTITEENWLEAASLSVAEEQKNFVAPAVGILARGYVYRDCNARVWMIEWNGQPVGLALVREFTEEPLGYDLQQLMIDRRFQGRGIGTAALRLILEGLREEGHYGAVGGVREAGGCTGAAFVPESGLCRQRLCGPGRAGLCEPDPFAERYLNVKEISHPYPLRHNAFRGLGGTWQTKSAPALWRIHLRCGASLPAA